jgi:hypothetical protein
MMREIEQFYSTQIEEMPMFVFPRTFSLGTFADTLPQERCRSHLSVTPALSPSFHTNIECKERIIQKFFLLLGFRKAVLGILFRLVGFSENLASDVGVFQQGHLFCHFVSHLPLSVLF